MADWEDDWENEVAAAAKTAKKKVVQQVAPAGGQSEQVQPKKKITLEPMTLDDYKKMKEMKMTIEQYQLEFKQPVIEKAPAPPVQWEEDYYGEKKTGKGRGKKQKDEEKGKGKKDKGKDKGKEKGKGKDKGKGKGEGRDDKGRGKKGTKGKGKEGVDFDDGVQVDSGKGKKGSGKGKMGGKGEYDAFWGDEHGAIVENYNANAPDLNQQDVNRNMMLATREAFLGGGVGSTHDQDTHFTTKKWETQDNLCDLSFDALKDNFQYEYMTKVQAWSYPFITAG